MSMVPRHGGRGSEQINACLQNFANACYEEQETFSYRRNFERMCNKHCLEILRSNAGDFQ